MKHFYGKKGSALLLSMLVIIAIGTMAISYFRFSRVTALSQVRESDQLIAKEVAEIATVEAYEKLLKESKTDATYMYWFLKGAVAGKIQPIETPFTNEYINKLLPKGYIGEVTTKVKITRYKKLQPLNVTYFGAYEGHGILAIETKANIYKLNSSERKNVSFHELEKHYDFFIASAIAMDEKGSMLVKPLVVRKDREMGELDVITSTNTTLNLHGDLNFTQPIILENFNPYNQYSLWANKNLTLKDLQRLNIIDTLNKKLNLNGIVHCTESIILNGDYTITGQGVIVADDISINGGIAKTNNNDLCVLFANKGNIKINTDKELNCAFIAINSSFTGTLEVTKKLNIKGLLIVDVLDIRDWHSAEHNLYYDTNFKNGESANRILLSTWLNYRRTNEKL